MLWFEKIKLFDSVILYTFTVSQGHVVEMSSERATFLCDEFVSEITLVHGSIMTVNDEDQFNAPCILPLNDNEVRSSANIHYNKSDMYIL